MKKFIIFSLFLTFFLTIPSIHPQLNQPSIQFDTPPITCTPLTNNGDWTLDIVFVPENSYIDPNQFLTDVVDQINNVFYDIEPFKSYENKMNFYVLNKRFDGDDLQFTYNKFNYDPLNDSVRTICPDMDYIIVLKNVTWWHYPEKYNWYSYEGRACANNNAYPIVTIHEFAHTMGLDDEYVHYEDQEYPFDVPAQVNGVTNCFKATTEDECLANAPWNDIIGNGCGQPNVIDCDPSDIRYEYELGCFEGCLFYGKGIYRPTRNSLMQEHPITKLEFGLQNERVLIEKIEEYTFTTTTTIRRRRGGGGCGRWCLLLGLSYTNILVILIAVVVVVIVLGSFKFFVKK